MTVQVWSLSPPLFTRDRAFTAVFPHLLGTQGLGPGPGAGPAALWGLSRGHPVSPDARRHDEAPARRPFVSQACHRALRAAWPRAPDSRSPWGERATRPAPDGQQPCPFSHAAAPAPRPPADSTVPGPGPAGVRTGARRAWGTLRCPPPGGRDFRRARPGTRSKWSLAAGSDGQNGGRSCSGKTPLAGPAPRDGRGTPGWQLGLLLWDHPSLPWRRGAAAPVTAGLAGRTGGRGSPDALDREAGSDVTDTCSKDFLEPVHRGSQGHLLRPGPAAATSSREERTQTPAPTAKADQSADR